VIEHFKIVKIVKISRLLRRESLLHDIIAGRMKGKAAHGRKRMHLLCDMMKQKYVAVKRTAEDKKEIVKSWKSYTCFSADYLKKKLLVSTAYSAWTLLVGCQEHPACKKND